MTPIKIIQGALAALVLTLAACGGGGSSSDGDSATAATGSGVAGIWRTDISNIIADNPGLIAGARSNCSGPVVLVLRADGRYTYDLDGVCTTGGLSGTAQSNVEGNYRVDGGQMVVSGSVGTGLITLGSISQSLVLMSDGVASYSVTATQLELHPASGPGTVQRFTRSSS
jgi:hypothetical protein